MSHLLAYAISFAVIALWALVRKFMFRGSEGWPMVEATVFDTRVTGGGRNELFWGEVIYSFSAHRANITRDLKSRASLPKVGPKGFSSRSSEATEYLSVTTLVISNGQLCALRTTYRLPVGGES